MRRLYFYIPRWKFIRTGKINGGYIIIIILINKNLDKIGIIVKIFSSDVLKIYCNCLVL